MGTGASVALSSSDFCLLSSNLLTLLTVLDLAKATFNKSARPSLVHVRSRRYNADFLVFGIAPVITNFAWACCFNTVLVPIAAGAFYDLGRTRLPPVRSRVSRLTTPN